MAEQSRKNMPFSEMKLRSKLRTFSDHCLSSVSFCCEKEREKKPRSHHVLNPTPFILVTLGAVLSSCVHASLLFG